MTKLFSLEDRALVRVEGPAAADFLNRLLTLDCKRLAVGTQSRAFLLEARGRVVLPLRILRIDATTFELEAAQAEPVLEQLDRFHFGEALTFAADDQRVYRLLAGPEADALLAAAGLEAGPFCADQDVAILPTDRLPGARALWVRREVVPAVEAALRAAGAEVADAQVLETLRVFEGVAGDGEYGPDATPLEIGLAGITEGKGCYPGQEVIERTLALGRPARTLVRVALAGPVAEGTELTAEGEAVGRLTSVAPGPEGGWFGLALVRPKAAAGPFEAAGVAAQVR